MADQLQSHPKLLALTPEAEQAAGRVEIALTHFPFRLGRESRVAVINGEFTVLERRKSGKFPPNNDAYLIDHGKFLNISRQHFLIDKTENGFKIVDRNSACGTRVRGESIGGRDQGGEMELFDGDSIVVGSQDSPFVFRFVASSDHKILELDLPDL